MFLDDQIVSGTTSNLVKRFLKDLGAREVNSYFLSKFSEKKSKGRRVYSWKASNEKLGVKTSNESFFNERFDGSPDLKKALRKRLNNIVGESLKPKESSVKSFRKKIKRSRVK